MSNDGSSQQPEWMPFRSLLEAVHEGVVLLDEDGRIVYANPAAVELLKIPRQREWIRDIDLYEHLTTRVRLETLDGEPVRGDAHPVQRLQAGDSFERERFVARSRTRGLARVYEFTATTLPDAPGSRVLFVRDGVEHLQDPEVHQAAFDMSPIPCLVVHLETSQIVAASDGAIDVLGDAREEVIGRSILHFMAIDPAIFLRKSHDLDRGEHGVLRLRTHIRTANSIGVEIVLWASKTETAGEPRGIYTFLDRARLQAALDVFVRPGVEERNRFPTHSEVPDERVVRIARDLHDGPIQDLLALGAQIGAQEHILRARGETQASDLSRVLRERLVQIAANLRDTVRVARSISPDATDLWALLGQTTPGMRRASDPEVVLPTDDTSDLDEQCVVELYWVARESIANAVNHAQASRIEVTFERQDGQIVMLVSDDGIGFTVPVDVQSLARGGHFGLLGMRERVEARGGTLQIETEPGRGTTIECRIPLAGQHFLSKS